MAEKKIANVQYGDAQLAHLFETGNGVLNRSIKLTDDDIRNKTKILCNEVYAPELFAQYVNRSNTFAAASKDVAVGDSIRVSPRSYNMQTKIVYCEGVGNGVLVEIPFSEFVYDLSKLNVDDVFDVVVTKADGGAYVCTCKNPKKYREELEESYRENKWFDVKIVNLIRGGYRALYKGTIECFIPGSHAGANVVGDFQQLIGTELPVMVDNYDWSSRMYVVSYKKYVKHSISTKIHDIKFGHKYKGVLTSNPTEFGLFIEFENYFTGLAHRVDFQNYAEISKQYKAGDVVDVYVKNITDKNGNYRVILTFDENMIDADKLTWYKFKTTCENKTLGYVYNPERKSIIITLSSGEPINISLPADFNTDSLAEYDKIMIHDINVLRQEMKFDFCK